MNSPNAFFEAPFLHNTQSPYIMTYDEFLGGKLRCSVVARYPNKIGETLTFYLIADTPYPSLDIIEIYSEQELWGTNVDRTRFSELEGKQVHAFFVVTRDSTFVGFSAMLRFEILAQ
ncbi:hypothetical protein [Pseudomonas sp. Irchel s3a10]|uniref:hypothetical protein n=1 Tax=Pseudomonas sp. Irchel s3a10 TaxID=2009045 RepID=UPI000BA31978|nr:hypothetical protein [Pseudomonas sp. Irchel s3a10]